MSGIAGIVNRGGESVDTLLLERMLASLVLSGPDAQNTWTDGGTGLIHALLKTTHENEHEQQPFDLDGKIWVVSDARIDAREDLIAELRVKGGGGRQDVPDAELIARAYSVWQEGCVEHLLGDFAFAIWDAVRNLLFCARDHMGVKPFYYAYFGSTIVFSNALDCVRLYPSVSARLNHQVIGDFLLFNQNFDQAKTAFANIDRLPPGHTLTFSTRGLQLRRYWTLPIDEPIFYPRESDYPDRFRQLLQVAVQDRLRAPRVSVLMSGGLDSTTLATTANRLLAERGQEFGTRAFTVAHHDDEETAHAKSAAENLSIPIQLLYWEPARFNRQWLETPLHVPEPIPYPTDLLRDWEDYRQLALHSRVAFQGEGPDNALRCEWRPYFSYLLRKGLLGRLFKDLHFQTVLHGRLPLPTIPWLSRMRKLDREKLADFPDWFHPEFERQYQLRSRWEQVRNLQPSHPVRPLAYGSLVSPLWQSIFERFQPEYTRSAFEVRHPYLDVRLLRFMLAVPALPWCRHKYLLRRTMQEELPASVLTRPKVPLTNDPWEKHVMSLGLPRVDFTPELEHYVDKSRVLEAPSDPARFWTDFRVRSLSYWLRNMNLS